MCVGDMMQPIDELLLNASMRVLCPPYHWRRYLPPHVVWTEVAEWCVPRIHLLVKHKYKTIGQLLECRMSRLGIPDKLEKKVRRLMSILNAMIKAGVAGRLVYDPSECVGNDARACGGGEGSQPFI